MLYFAVIVLCSFMSDGALYPLFSWRLFNASGDSSEFFDVRVTTDTRTCLLARCFRRPRDRAIALNLIEKISTPLDSSCEGIDHVDARTLELLRQQIEGIFFDEKVRNLEFVSIKNSFIDYILKKVTDEEIDQKSCLSF